MEFTNTFTIPVEVDEAFAVLTDLERVAPCMPGAKLESVEGDTYTGRVKVKVGPMSLTYKGTARVVDVDDEAHTARIEARGNAARGGGTAAADVSATLTEVDEGTQVEVVTELTITGKPAQFGRGTMGDVGAKIIDTFAECLSRRLAESPEDEGAEEDEEAAAGGTEDGQEPVEAAAAAAGEEPVEGDGDVDIDATTSAPRGSGADALAGATAAADATDNVDVVDEDAPGPRAVVDTEPEVEALDLMDVAGDAAMKRVIPLVAILLGVGLIIWLLRRRGSDDED